MQLDNLNQIKQLPKPKTENYYTPPNTTNNNNPPNPASIPEPANLPGLGLVAIAFGVFRHKRDRTTCVK
ncbi:MAG: PEP-CTERM sorting domain-containing protein [Nostoc sp. DedSLP01]